MRGRCVKKNVVCDHFPHLERFLCPPPTRKKHDLTSQARPSLPFSTLSEKDEGFPRCSSANTGIGNSLAVQCLRLSALTVKSLGSGPGWETKILQAAWCNLYIQWLSQAFLQCLLTSACVWGMTSQLLLQKLPTSCGRVNQTQKPRHLEEGKNQCK